MTLEISSIYHQIGPRIFDGETGVLVGVRVFWDVMIYLDCIFVVGTLLDGFGDVDGMRVVPSLLMEFVRLVG